MTVAPFITIVAAGGAGKSTLIRHLLENIPNTRFLKLYTTRPPDAKRGESESSLEYNFVTQEQYQALKKKAGKGNWEELNSGKHLYGVDIRTIEPQREQGTIFLSTMILQRISLDTRIQLYRPPVIYVTLDVPQDILIQRGIPMERILRKTEPIDRFKKMSSLVLTQTGDIQTDLNDGLNQIQKLLASFTTNPS
jgi:ribose 1,5-bisphosphokinase PhnN